MSINDGSQNLFSVLRELLRKGELNPGTVNSLVIFVVAAIVLNGFLVTTFLIVMLVIKTLLR